MKGKILFVDSVHHSLEESLISNGWMCVDGTGWSYDDILNRVHEYTGVVIRSRFRIDKNFLAAAKSLQFIARAGAGMENIDVPAAVSSGVHCLNAPEGNRNAVAEHALGMMLSLFNNLVTADREVRNGSWLREENRGVELKGKTVAIIGFGNTGSTFARKLSSMETTILAYDPFIAVDTNAFPYVQQAEMKDIFFHADILSLHVPLTPETIYLVNENYINRFEKNFYLLNTSRGKTVSIKALNKALETGKIKGAALDVLEFEHLSFESLHPAEQPRDFTKLCEFKNVLLSPHVAGWTHESHAEISIVLANKINVLFP